LIRPALDAGHLHPAVASYICEALQAIAGALGADVAPWHNGYLNDFQPRPPEIPDDTFR